ATGGTRPQPGRREAAWTGSDRSLDRRTTWTPARDSRRRRPPRSAPPLPRPARAARRSPGLPARETPPPGARARRKTPWPAPAPRPAAARRSPCGSWQAQHRDPGGLERNGSGRDVAARRQVDHVHRPRIDTFALLRDERVAVVRRVGDPVRERLGRG